MSPARCTTWPRGRWTFSPDHGGSGRDEGSLRGLDRRCPCRFGTAAGGSPLSAAEPRPDPGVCRGADGRRGRGRASRRGRGAPGGRALRNAGAGARDHGDRSGPGRVDDARRRAGEGRAGARFGVRGGDDHLHGGRRRLRAGRRAAPPRAVLPHRRGRAGARGPRHAGHDGADPAGLHDVGAGAALLHGPARLHGGRFALALGRVRVRADDSPPRLLPASGGRRRTRAPTPRRPRCARPG